MLKSFTSNSADNSTDAGFQFTFYCDICGDGFKSSFIESETYKKRSGLRALSRGASLLGNLVGGRVGDLGYSLERGTDIITDRFDGQSPEWQKEHERAFEMASNEAKKHFHRCESCHKWVCQSDFNEEQGLCVECAPRESAYVAKARGEAMRRNIDEAAETATVWSGKVESRTITCPTCGKPAGEGKFCNNCGAPLGRNKCPQCGADVALGVKFCQECGFNMNAPRALKCPGCGAEVAPGTKFCGGCGTKIG